MACIGGSLKRTVENLARPDDTDWGGPLTFRPPTKFFGLESEGAFRSDGGKTLEANGPRDVDVCLYYGPDEMGRDLQQRQSVGAAFLFAQLSSPPTHGPLFRFGLQIFLAKGPCEAIPRIRRPTRMK